MAFELVIARYEEDLSWLSNVPEEYRITVYNKRDTEASHFPPAPQGLRREGREPVREVNLPNIGHEDQAYLYHIVERYEDLADVTVFCQGKPFDHVPDFHRTLKKLTNGQLAINDFLWLGFVIDRDDQTGSLLFQKWNPGRELPMQSFWPRVFTSTLARRGGFGVERSMLDVPPSCVFYPGAHFIVTAEQIRKQPREFYENALKVSTDLPDAGHCFERCWDKVFGVNGIPERYRDADYPIYLRPIKRLGITWDDVPKEARPWTTRD